MFTDFPKERRNEALYLKNEIEKINTQIKNKEIFFKNTMEKLEKEYIETNQINIELKKKLESYESNNNNNEDIDNNNNEDLDNNNNDDNFNEKY